MRIFTVLFCLSFVVFPLTANADLVPPDVASCDSKKAGDTCTTADSKSGTCQPSKCTKNDYSDGSPPQQIETDCLKCTASSTAPPKPTDAGTTTDTGTTKEDEPKAGGGCNIQMSLPLSATLWLMLLVGGFLLAFRKRSKTVS